MPSSTLNLPGLPPSPRCSPEESRSRRTTWSWPLSAAAILISTGSKDCCELMARPLFLFLSLLLSSCVSASATQTTELPPPRVIERTQTPFSTDTAAPTFLPSPTTAIPSTESPTAPPPTHSPTTAPTLAAPASTAASAPATAALAPTTAPVAGVSSHVYSRPIIIANYLAWYDTGSW